jgi:hypothetical protein
MGYEAARLLLTLKWVGLVGPFFSGRHADESTPAGRDCDRVRVNLLTCIFPWAFRSLPLPIVAKLEAVAKTRY